MDELSDNPCAGVVRFRFGGYDLSSHRQRHPFVCDAKLYSSCIITKC